MPAESPPVPAQIRTTVDSLISDLQQGHASYAVQTFNREYRALSTQGQPGYDLSLANLLMYEATRRMQQQGLLPTFALQSLNQNGGFAAADTNHDGRLSATEIASRGVRRDLLPSLGLTFDYLGNETNFNAINHQAYREGNSSGTEHRADSNNSTMTTALMEAHAIRQRVLQSFTETGGNRVVLNQDARAALNLPNADSTITWDQLVQLRDRGTPAQQDLTRMLLNNAREITSSNWFSWTMTRTQIENWINAGDHGQRDRLPSLRVIPTPLSDTISQFAGTGTDGHWAEIAGRQSGNTNQITQGDLAAFNTWLTTDRQPPATTFERSMVQQLQSRFAEIANASGAHPDNPNTITQDDLQAYRLKQQQLHAASQFFTPEYSTNLQQDALNALRQLHPDAASLATPITQQDLNAVIALPENSQNHAKRLAAQYLHDHWNEIARLGTTNGQPDSAISISQISEHIRSQTMAPVPEGLQGSWYTQHLFDSYGRWVTIAQNYANNTAAGWTHSGNDARGYPQFIRE